MRRERESRMIRVGASVGVSGAVSQTGRGQMHELSIALSIIDVAAAEAERRGARVVAVHVQLGAIAGVARPALVAAYQLARETTPLADAELVIEEVPITVRCPACQTARPVRSLQEWSCAVCGTFSAEMLTGRELDITALELAR